MALQSGFHSETQVMSPKDDMQMSLFCRNTINAPIILAAMLELPGMTRGPYTSWRWCVFFGFSFFSISCASGCSCDKFWSDF